MVKQTVVFRQSRYLLLLRLLGVEIIMVTLYLLFRIPKIAVFNSLNINISPAFDWAGLLVFIGSSFLELMLITGILLSWFNEEYEIHPDTVVHRRGVFRHEQDTYSLRNLGSATVSQGWLGRLLNFGTIRLYSPILKQEFFLFNIDRPQQKLALLQDDLENPASRSQILPRRS